MNQSDHTTPTPTPGDTGSQRTLITWRDVAAAIDELISTSERSIDVFDHSLALQAWGDRGRCEALNRAMTDRRVQVRIMLVDARHVLSELPRLTQLLKTQAHRLQILCTSERSIPEANFVVADRQQLLLRPNSVHSRGYVDFDNSYKSMGYLRSFEVLWQLGGERVFPEAFGL